MRFFLTLIAVFLITLPALAGDLVIIAPTTGKQGGGLSGTVTKVRGDTLTIETSEGEKIKIDTDELDYEGRLHSHFKVGQTISVSGIREDDDEIIARHITNNETGESIGIGTQIIYNNIHIK